MRKIIFFFAIMVFLVGCNIETSKVDEIPNFIYKVGDCDETRTQEKGSLDVAFSENEIEINQVLSYVCCAKIVLRYEIFEDTLRVYEDNNGEVCRCVCSYDINAKLTGARDINKVEVYGIKHGEVSPYELLGSKDRYEVEEETESAVEECVADSDCVEDSCCHAKGCVPKEKAPECKAVACTMNCEPGTLDCGQGACVCADGKCEAEFY